MILDDTPPEPTAPAPATALATTPIATTRARRLRWLRLGHALLPFMLASAAIGVHFAINVPSSATIERLRLRAEENRTKKRDKKKPKKKGERNVTERVASAPYAPRSADELKEERKRYFGTPFDKEPTLSEWARKSQTLLGRAVTVARDSAFEGALEPARVSVGTTRCRTVRCRFVVRSPYPHELDLLVDALHLLQYGEDGKDLFRTIEVKGVPADEHGGKPEDAALRITVMLDADEIDPAGIVIAQDDENEGR